MNDVEQKIETAKLPGYVIEEWYDHSTKDKFLKITGENNNIRIWINGWEVDVDARPWSPMDPTIVVTHGHYKNKHHIQDEYKYTREYQELYGEEKE